ncbi:MAG: deoxyhypusine synthase family protein [Candidatus Bathyarchaeota archaeon]|nr:MAG: deoxyhypusine synthase family protein [Candidatus Bathyarchaeota archaeon]
MAHTFLRKKIAHVDLRNISSIDDLITAFSGSSFQSRNLAKCVDTFVTMLTDEERPTVFLGLAGAMVPAGMKKVISYMVIKNMIDVVVSTGANMYHDVVEALGGHHYQGSIDIDDRILYEHSIDRIYDVFANEKKYRDVDNEIMALADEAAQSSTTMSSRRFLSLLGEYIDHSPSTSDKEGSIVWNCWKYQVPIFVPALNDSSIGLGITQHYVKYLQKGLTPLAIDAIRDNYEIFQIKKAAKKTGVIYVGGGVPKNYIQQTAYLQDLFGLPDSGHDYGVQLTTDRPEWGGLSGATFKEGLSWGKERPQGMYATCYCDATISLPILVKAALERIPSDTLRTTRLNFQFAP